MLITHSPPPFRPLFLLHNLCKQGFGTQLLFYTYYIMSDSDSPAENSAEKPLPEEAPTVDKPKGTWGKFMAVKFKVRA